MSRTIDERVVEMRFDNQKFEDNVQTSLGTLEKLKKALKLDDAAKGLEEVEQASRKVKLNGLSSAIETVSLKFSALDVAAARVFQRLTDAAIDTGRKMVNALAFQSSKDGFSEYELKMGSVQTIMAGTGESLETVNRYLEELNKYSDQTIYSFSDMTNNIGKFTNAGVKLDKAVLAIKGVSNVAAVSGATAEEASRAMYNFSQALSAGYVKLIDWKSIENANMATQEFKQQLLDTAIELGTIVKYGDQYATVTTNAAGKTYQAFDATSNFNDSLAYQWMTTDVLTSTLAKYADETTDIGKKAYAAAQDIKTFSMLIDTLKEALGSGWAQTWELLIGDFNEAKTLFTDVGNELSALIETSSEARNSVLYEGMASGWKKWLKEGIDDGEMYKTVMMETAREQGVSIDEMVKQAGSLEKTFQNGWITNDLLAASVDKLVSKYDGLSKEEKEEMGITQAQIDHARELQQKLKDGTIDVAEYAKAFGELSGRENLIEAIKNTFHSLMDIVHSVKEAFSDIFPPLTGERLKEFTVKVRELTERFKVSEETAGKIREVFSGVFSVVKAGIEIFKNIGKAVGQALGVLAPGGGRILDVLATIGSGISRAAEALTSSKAFTDFFTGLGNVLSSVVQRLSGWVKPLADFISDFTAKVREMGSLKAGVQWAWQQITAGLNSLKSRLPDLSGIGKWFAGLWDGIMNGFSAGSGGKLLDGLKSGISSVWKGLLNWFSGIGSSEFLQGIRNRTAVLWGRMTEFLSGLGIQLPSFEKLGATFEKLWGKIKTVYDKVINSAFVQKVKKILTGLKNSFVGFVTGMVGKLPRFTGLGNIFTKVWGKIQQVWSRIVGSEFLRNVQTGLGKLKTAFLDFLSRISVKLPSFETLGGIFARGWEAIRSGFEAIGQSEFIQKSKAGLVQLKDRFIEFITGMNLKLPSFEALGEKLQSVWGKIKAVFSTVGGWLGKAFQPISDFISKFKEKLSSFDSVGEAMEWAWATAKEKLNGILESVKSWFASIDIWALIGKYWYIPAGLAVAGIVKLLGNIMTIMKGAFAEDLAHLNESKAKTPIGKTVLQIAGALLMVAGALYLVSTIDKEKLKPAAETLLITAGIIGLLATVMGLLNKFKIGDIGTGAKSMMMLGIGILAMAAALKLLEWINPKGLLGRVMVLTGVVVALGLAFRIAGKQTGDMKGAVGFAAATAILVLTLKLLEGMDMSTMLPAVGVLVGIMFALAACLNIAKRQSGQAKGMMPFAIAIALLAATLGKLGGMEKSKLIQGSIALGAMMAALTICMKVLGSMRVDVKSIILLGALVGSLYLFADVFESISGVDTRSMIGFAGSISAILLSLAGAMSILGKLSPAQAGIGVANLAIVIAGLGAIMVALGALQKAWSDLDDFLVSGGDVLGLIGEGIGKFIKGVLGIDDGGILTTIGNNVKGFIDAVQPAIEGLSDIDETAKTGAANLTGALLEICKGEFVTALTSIFTDGDPISKYKTNLVTMADALKTYAENIGGFASINPTDVANSTTAAAGLAALAQAIPSIGGLWQGLVGTKDLGLFAKDISVLGENLKSYATGLSGFTTTVSESDITNSAVAARGLAELAQAIPPTGGMWQGLAGTKDLGVFGDSITNLGANLKSYATGLSGFTTTVSESDITNSAVAARGLAELAQAIPPTGGLWQGLVGTKDLGAFGDSITNLGANLKSYATGLSGFTTSVTEEDITASTNAAMGLTALADALPPMGGWWNTFAGTKDLGNFSEDMSALGRALAAFAEGAGTVDATKSESAIGVLGAVQEFTNGLSTAGGLWNSIGEFFNGSKTEGLLTLTGNMATVGDNFGKFAAGINEAETAQTNLQALIDTLTSFSSVGEEIGDGNAVQTRLSGILDGMTAALTAEEHQKAFGNAGILLMNALTTGMNNQQVQLQILAGNLAVTAANAMSGKYQSFHTAGFNAVMGFANAIAEYTWYAERQASNMAQLAANAAMRALDEHSPSRVTYGIGQYFSEGFANGISAYASGAVHAADGMAEGAAVGLNNAIGKISAMLDGSIDTTPTIRPVVDLSSAVSGAAALNNLFAMNPSMSSFGGSIALHNVGELRLEDGRMSRGTDNQNVVDAITRLESRFNNLSEAVSHMQIVLDSGTLVGETRAQMDQQLGFTAAMRERGN